MAFRLDDATGEEEKKAKNRLRDLKVPDVDIVDRPAIQRRFLIVKKEDGMPEETNGSEFSTGNIDVDLADPESGTSPAATDDAKPEDVAKAEEIKKAAETHAALLAEKTAAIKTLADEISTGAGTMDVKDLKAKINQLERLGWKIEDDANVVSVSKTEGEDAAKARGEGMGAGGPRQGDGGASTCVCPKCGAEVEHGKGTPCAESKCPKCGASMVGKGDVAKAIPTPVRDAVVKALREASERLMSVNVALRGAPVPQDRVDAPLPDPVAREIKAIRTLVKSVLQRYPAPAAKAEGEEETAPELPEVGYETAHDLMKQAASITLPAPVRDAVTAKVRGASELLLSIVSAVQKMETTEERLPSPLPAETATAVGKALGILDEVIEKYPAPAAKSDDVVAALGQHFKSIEKLVAGLAGGTVVVKEEPKPAEDPRIGELMKRVEENAILLKKVAGKSADSNALEDQGRTTVAKGGEGETEWPEDMASEGN